MMERPFVTLQTDFAVIACSVEVNRPIEETWDEIGGFADAGRFLNISSKLVSGEGRIGSVRVVGETIVEVMAGCSAFSYTYAQISGPMAAFSYHGCLEVVSLNPGNCRLTYTLTYDQSAMDSARRATEFERLSQRFSKAAQAMKLAAETGRADIDEPSF